MGVEDYIYLRIVYLNKFYACGFKGHKLSHCRHKVKTKIKNNIFVKYTTEHATIEKVERKYIHIRLNNKKIKFQIDTGAGLTIINAGTCEKKLVPNTA